MAAAPSDRNPRIFRFIRETVGSHLDHQPAWPLNLLKLQLEKAGIYQDFSGQCLQELNDRGHISIGTHNHKPYIAPSGVGSPSPRPEIVEATERVYEFFSEQRNAYFAELTAYVALSKVYQELGDVPIDVYPKGNYPHKLRGATDELDGMIEFYQERFPIEVYNGFQYVHDEHPKIGRVENISSEEEPTSNPILINRMASSFARRAVSDLDGTIIDTATVMGCEDHNPDLNDALETIQIEDHFHLLPRLETSEGLRLDGEIYDTIAPDQDEYYQITPTKVAAASEQLPESYLRRIRGGVHLLYVNTFYRRTTEPIEQQAALVLQEMYHVLLRQSSGMSLDDLIPIGWQNFRNHYREMKADIDRFQDDILDNTRQLFQELRDQNIVIERNGSLYARASDHPHATLEF